MKNGKHFGKKKSFSVVARPYNDVSAYAPFDVKHLLGSGFSEQIDLLLRTQKERSGSRQFERFGRTIDEFCLGFGFQADEKLRKRGLRDAEALCGL